jgi:hypothetical protein
MLLHTHYFTHFFEYPKYFSNGEPFLARGGDGGEDMVLEKLVAELPGRIQLLCQLPGRGKF